METRSGSVTDTKQFVYSGAEICEARDGSSAVTAQYFGLGEKQGSSAYCYEISTDGPRGMVNSSGTEVSSIAYGPWGEPTVLSGSVLPAKQYRGMYAHGPSGLNLTWFRQYSSSNARWLSRDPIGERGGTNLFSYAANNPISNSDPDGRVVVTAFNMPAPLNSNLFSGSGLPGINSMFGPLFGGSGSSCGGSSSNDQASPELPDASVSLSAASTSVGLLFGRSKSDDDSGFEECVNDALRAWSECRRIAMQYTGPLREKRLHACDKALQTRLRGCQEKYGR